MVKGTRFAYLIEFDDVSSIETVSPNCIGIGAKSGNLYLKYASGSEKIIYGADSALTTGCLISKSATGFQDSPIFVYNGNIGIGTTVPDCPLTVIRETTGSIFSIDRYLSTSGGAAILCRKARGTLASPSLPDADDIVGGIFNQIWSGSAWINSSTIRGLCDGTPTSSSSPGKLVFQTTPSGSTTLADRMTIRQNGYIGIGTASPIGLLHVHTSGSAETADASFQIIRECTGSTNNQDIYINSASGAGISFRKARGTFASPSDAQGNDIAGGVIGWLWSGSAWGNIASMRIAADGSNSVGKIYFQTNGNNTRVTIKNDGKVGIGTETPSSLLHMHHASDAADFYISSARTTEGRIASFNLQGTASGNYFRFVWRSYTQSGITSDEVIQTVFDAENTLWRQIVRFRLKNRYLFIGEDSLLTYFSAPVHGFGTSTPSEMVEVNGNVRATGFMAGADAGVDISSGTLKAVTVKKGIITAGSSVTPIADGTYTIADYKYMTISGGIITALVADN